jgi:hypothetical protein
MIFPFGAFELELDDFEEEVITSTNKVKVIKKDGEVCAKCKDFCKYAEPNQKDGTFKCYVCRNRF